MAKMTVGANKIKVFCSGRFYFNYLDDDYAQFASLDYRARLLRDVNKLLYPKKSYMISDHVEYIGPFYYECENMDANNIVATKCEMLKKCTDAYFILDKADAPGSISELIYAASLQKRIHIFYVRLTDEEETESSLHTPNWYPITMCEQLNCQTKLVACRSREEAESIAIQMIKNL